MASVARKLLQQLSVCELGACLKDLSLLPCTRPEGHCMLLPEPVPESDPIVYTLRSDIEEH